MNYQELNEALHNLDRAMYTLEETYIANEGEVTEETQQMEDRIESIKALLSTEGIDLLGSWLKSKEDRKKALKAEKDYITRQMAAIDKTIEFIKEKVNEVMAATGIEKVKGDRGYSFAATTSVKTDVDKEFLNAAYKGRAEVALLKAGIPPYIGFTLTASSSLAKSMGIMEGDEGLFITTETPTVRFGKPRASKEE